MYLCVMKDVLFESSMPKYWRISTTTGERTAGGDYGYATVWVPYSTASEAHASIWDASHWDASNWNTSHWHAEN